MPRTQTVASAAPATTRKKNKPMSKQEQERQIQDLKNISSQFQNPTPSIENAPDTCKSSASGLETRPFLRALQMLFATILAEMRTIVKKVRRSRWYWRDTISKCARATTYYHLRLSQGLLHWLAYSCTRSHTTNRFTLSCSQILSASAIKGIYSSFSGRLGSIDRILLGGREWVTFSSKGAFEAVGYELSNDVYKGIPSLENVEGGEA